MNIKNLFKHLRTIFTHKYYVFIGCCKLGIPFRGLLHDLSKFSPIELSTAKYWNGSSSPIPAEKALKGYSLGWIHHKNCNKHHWEYWVDFKQKTPIFAPMPKKYLLEMFADWYGASRAYNDGKFDGKKLIDYIQPELENKIMLHPETRKIVDMVFHNALYFSHDGYFYRVEEAIRKYVA